MDRGGWWAAVHKAAESDMTEGTWRVLVNICKFTFIKIFLKKIKIFLVKQKQGNSLQSDELSWKYQRLFFIQNRCWWRCSWNSGAADSNVNWYNLNNYSALSIRPTTRQFYLSLLRMMHLWFCNRLYFMCIWNFQRRWEISIAKSKYKKQVRSLFRRWDR